MRRTTGPGRLALAAVTALGVTLAGTSCSGDTGPGPLPGGPSAAVAKSPAPAPDLTHAGVRAAASSTASGVQGRPNVVLFIVDDLGFADTAMADPAHASVRGGTSPVMDEMARTGVSFDGATSSPNCAPTRASLLTGTASTNPTNNIYTVVSLGRYPKDAMAVAPDQGLMPHLQKALARDALTWAEVLRDAGYSTGHVGKFHVTQETHQIDQWHGFDFNAGGNSAGYASKYRAEVRTKPRVEPDSRVLRRARPGTTRAFGVGVDPSLDAWADDYTQRYVNRNIRPYSSGVDDTTLDALVGTRKNVSDAVADASWSFIKDSASKNKPFALEIGSYAVHAPINGRETRPDLATKYGVTDRRPLANIRGSYDAILEETDQALGRVLHTLDNTADPRNPGHMLSDNTIVFLTSDNGGVIDSTAEQGGLRDEKSSLYDGAVRVPWVAWSKNKSLVPSGEVRHQDINATDFYPTLLQATGTPVPNPDVIDGVSWWPAIKNSDVDLLAGRDTNRTARVIHFPGYLARTGARPSTMIRTSKWKLFYRYETASWQLYDLVNDRGETTDVSAEHTDVVHELGQQMLDWLVEHNAPLVYLGSHGFALRQTHFTGSAYSSRGTVEHLEDATVTLQPGDPLPLLLPDDPSRLVPATAPVHRFRGGLEARNLWTQIATDQDPTLTDGLGSNVR